MTDLFATSDAGPRATQEVIEGNCLIEMRKMPAQSVAVIVTSPPYNLGMDQINAEMAGCRSRYSAPRLTEGGIMR